MSYPIAPVYAKVGGPVEDTVPPGHSYYTGPPFSDNPTPLVAPPHGYLVAGSLNPSFTSLGAPDFTMMFIGEGFVDGCKIMWNGAEEPTTFVSDKVVTTIVKPSTAVGETVVQVHVVNPDGGRTRDLPFSIAGKVWAPPAPPTPPALTAVTPNPVNLAIGSGTTPTTLTLTGSGFTAASVVKIDTPTVGTSFNPVGSTYVSPTSLTISLALNDATSVGVWQVTVTEAGLTSAPASFTVAAV